MYVVPKQPVIFVSLNCITCYVLHFYRELFRTVCLHIWCCNMTLSWLRLPSHDSNRGLNWVNIFLIYYEIIHPFSWQQYSIVWYICPCTGSISWVSAFQSAPNLIGFGVLSVAAISSDLSVRVYRIVPICFHFSLPYSTHTLYSSEKNIFTHYSWSFLRFASCTYLIYILRKCP